ncbi:DUF4157 domain-containing protein [Deinococcus sp.]|uniref:eCIS core domain-containing protein n=1 Tax=Deinococcus sp. TaxID=47478 RepID=UPI0025BC6D80|nr:DUF4157 domain-containing protein [Deinococcus sp.]
MVLGMVPPSERLPLQRATDEALQRQRAQEQAALNFGTLTSLQRQMAELDAEATQPVLQRIQARRGAGNPLPEAIQRHLEGGLNYDLSRVRIHDDAEADKLAKGVNAVAFTTGTDIFFQAGQFNPNTQSGLELLAHEVTHTVQQSQGRVGTGIDPDAGLEAEARSVGKRLAAYTVMPGVQKRDMLSIASASAADRVQRQVNQQLRQANANRGAIAKVPQAAESDVYYQLREFNNGIPKDLTFDHGFLEGADGKFDASLMEKPTWADRKNRAFWVAKAQAALILRPDLFDSIAAYMHFLEASGRERDVGYERFLKNDPAGKVISKSLISSVQRGIGERIFFAEGLKEGEKYTSAGSTPIITTGSANQMYPYPATENWQKTLGSHPLWADASWTFVYSKAQYIKVSATVEIRTRDMYNFNPGSKDIATGSPDAINGRFEVTGLGKEYINYGYAKRTVNFLFDKSKFFDKVCGSIEVSCIHSPQSKMNIKTLLCIMLSCLSLSSCRDQGQGSIEQSGKIADRETGQQVVYGGKIERFFKIDDVSQIGWLAVSQGVAGLAPGPSDYLLYAVFPFAGSLPGGSYPDAVVDGQVVKSFAAARIDLKGFLTEGKHVDASSLVLTSDVPVLALQRDGMVFIVLLLA